MAAELAEEMAPYTTPDTTGANCASDGDPDDFFPETGWGRPGPKAVEAYERAKAICEGCPVRAACLEMGRDEPFGVWGGLDPEERGVVRYYAKSTYRRIAPGTARQSGPKAKAL